MRGSLLHSIENLLGEKTLIKRFPCKIYGVGLIGDLIEWNQIKVFRLIDCTIATLLPWEGLIGVFSRADKRTLWVSVIIHIDSAVFFA